MFNLKIHSGDWVVVCDGAKGSHALTADAGAVRELRGAEVEFAADLLGAATLTKLERRDGEVENDVDLRRNLEARTDHAQRLVDGRHLADFELHVHGRTGDLNYVSDIFWHKTSAVGFWLLALGS